VGNSTKAVNQPGRRDDIDWLRVAATLLLIPYHTAVIFDGPTGGTSYVDGLYSPLMLALTSIVWPWFMPLFLLLAGASTCFALRRRAGSQYLGERVRRVLIPLIAGTLIVVPPMVYYRLLDKGTFEGSFLKFYPHFFNGVYPHGNFEYGHLWFLAYLFFISLVTLPVVLYFKRSGQGLIAGLAKIADRQGGIFLFAMPLMVINLALRAIWPGYIFNIVSDWANVIYFMTFFVYGYILFSDKRFQKSIDRHWKVALILVVLLELSRLTGIKGYTGHWLIQSTAAWCWVVAILGCGHRYLNFRNSWLSYASEASLPFYVLHNLLITAVAFYAVRQLASTWMQILTINLVALIGTVIVYDLAVRRTRVTRFLFGLK
jgi:glucans biosynthesis protein C